MKKSVIYLAALLLMISKKLLPAPQWGWQFYKSSNNVSADYRCIFALFPAET
jgi:hypothetical protein